MPNEYRNNCPMRHDNGNCLPCGGFCTAVNDPICEAMQNAYLMGCDHLATRVFRELRSKFPTGGRNNAE